MPSKSHVVVVDFQSKHFECFFGAAWIFNKCVINEWAFVWKPKIHEFIVRKNGGYFHWTFWELVAISLAICITIINGLKVRKKNNFRFATSII